MLRELVQASGWLRQQGRLGPVGYKSTRVNWIIDLGDEGEAQLLGPYRRRESPEFQAPTRYRSGKIGPDNLKPYILVDDARYALGIADPGKEDEAALVHAEFLAVLNRAYDATQDVDVGRVRDFLASPLQSDWQSQIGSRDNIAFRCGGQRYPFQNDAVAAFWSHHLADELVADEEAICGLCGRHGPVLQTVPVPVVVMGQKCQITSFNQTAFCSFGKQQTTNSPLCFGCTMSAIQALTHFGNDDRHHSVIARDTRKGKSDPMRNQLAIFWLKVPDNGQESEEAEDVDLDDVFAAFTAVLRGEVEEPTVGAPAADVAHIQSLLEVPWRARQSATRIAADAFCLAVLSANKGRLVVRDWLVVSLSELRDHLSNFLQASRVIDPRGTEARPFPIPAMLDALETTDAHLIRGILRTAYTGAPPPDALLAPAVRRFGVPRKKNESLSQYEARLHRLAATMKLALTHNTEEAERMEQRDLENTSKAYHCGRLLAVLEEAQRRASGGRLNATLVDRYYGAASTTPATVLGSLIKLAETAHLPQVRRKNRGAEALHQDIQEIMRQFGDREEIPNSLMLRDQARFALGFYHQRARYRGSFGRSQAADGVQSEPEPPVAGMR